MSGAYKYRPQYTQNTIGPSGNDEPDSVASLDGQALAKCAVCAGLTVICSEGDRTLGSAWHPSPADWQRFAEEILAAEREKAKGDAQ